MKIATSPLILDKALSILGWMSERELTWLARYAQDAKRIVEFGSFHGRSTRALADNSPEDAMIWAVDPWNGDYIIEKTGEVIQNINTYCLPQFKSNLIEHIISGKVIPVRTFSHNFILPHEIDLLFIDGDHGYNACKKDIEVGLKLVKKGGIISGHDYNHPNYPGVTESVTEIFGKVESEDSIWWARV